MVEKAVENRKYESLSQIERWIINEIEVVAVIEKVREKSNVHKIDSNKQSKRYFSLIPLLLSKA